MIKEKTGITQKKTNAIGGEQKNSPSRSLSRLRLEHRNFLLRVLQLSFQLMRKQPSTRDLRPKRNFTVTQGPYLESSIQAKLNDSV